ncbi:MAG: hypothetical protein JOY54_02725 [Acidobacteriaceae bacterium]|nr:hypothetical protein [Acidobacteriaceae bacterium]
MGTAQGARTARAKKFTIVSDSAQDWFEIVECADGAEGIAELNEKYPAAAGWMIVDSADTREEATLKLGKHRAEARRDFE